MKLGPASPGASLGEIVDELRDLERSFKALPPAAPAPAPDAAASAPPVPLAPPAPTPADAAGQPVPAVDALEEAAAPSAPAALDLARVKSAWEGVVQSVQDASLNLASAAKDAQLQALEGGTLTLLAVNGFQRKVLEDPNEQARLEQALGAALGQPLKVRVMMALPAARVARGGKPSADEVARLVRERPEIGRLKELFDAEVTEIRHED
jgi:hypothetical protein